MPVQLPDAGRRGDVDLGQVVADDVQPREQDALLAQGRADLFADPAVALAEFDALAGAAGGEVAARLAGRRYARRSLPNDNALSGLQPWAAEKQPAAR